MIGWLAGTVAMDGWNHIHLTWPAIANLAAFGILAVVLVFKQAKYR